MALLLVCDNNEVEIVLQALAGGSLDATEVSVTTGQTRNAVDPS
jgi:hypothetical protein